MTSEYQMWLTHNGESEKLRFPVLPETLTIKNGSANKSINISGLGEVVIKQDPLALVIEFDCFFPAASFPGVQVDELTPPEILKKKIMDWKNSDKPVHFLITGTDINMFCTIENFPCHEEGGDVGTVYYSLGLKEYRETTARQVKVDAATKTATVSPATPARPDNRVEEKTYKVVKGDTLCKIAKKFLGSSSKYMQLYNLNKDKIKNPNLIYVGQVLRLPT